jgi:hypothetical protein
MNSIKPMFAQVAEKKLILPNAPWRPKLKTKKRDNKTVVEIKKGGQRNG